MLIPTPYKSGFLPEQSGHEIYWQCFGNPSGAPFLFLHGGPGGGFETGYLPLFNLDQICLITFDQRGCGLSKPTGRIESNTTDDLIEDIERLRSSLNIDQWVVTGHSWGTTLAIAYAKAYPHSCRAVCIAAFFGAKAEDQNWTFSGLRQFFPKEVEKLHGCRLAEDKDLSVDDWIFKNMTSEDSALRFETAYSLMALETNCAQKSVEIPQRENVTDQLINIYKILFYYAKNNFFIDTNKLYERTRLPFPIILVHGQYDMDCPPAQAYRLQDSIENLDLRIVKTGNHSVFEDPMLTAYKNAIEELIK